MYMLRKIISAENLTPHRNLFSEESQKTLAHFRKAAAPNMDFTVVRNLIHAIITSSAENRLHERALLKLIGLDANIKGVQLQPKDIVLYVEKKAKLGCSKVECRCRISSYDTWCLHGSVVTT